MSNEFPRRYDGPFQKVKAHKAKRTGKGPTAKRRAAKARVMKKTELTAMLDVRFRDEYCRFPLCGCSRQGQLQRGRWEVSHAQHRGMGGNPAGDRTVPELMVLLCGWRHQHGKFSIDKKTLRWEPLTAAGANGPIRWWAHWPTLQEWALDEHGLVLMARPVDGWVLLAEETSPHALQPIEWPRVLELLAQMEY